MRSRQSADIFSNVIQRSQFGPFLGHQVVPANLAIAFGFSLLVAGLSAYAVQILSVEDRTLEVLEHPISRKVVGNLELREEISFKSALTPVVAYVCPFIRFRIVSFDRIAPPGDRVLGTVMCAAADRIQIPLERSQIEVGSLPQHRRATGPGVQIRVETFDGVRSRSAAHSATSDIQQTIQRGDRMIRTLLSH